MGRTLGFPTANIRVDEPFKVIPGIGVYAVWVEVEGERYKGMLYIGDRPTLNNGKDISMEVNILDFSGDIYNDSIRVSFVQYVRGDIKFDSLEDAIRKLMEEEQEKRAAEELGKETAKYGRKAMIVTGQNSTKRTGLLDRAKALMEKEGLEVVIFDKAEPNPLASTA